MLALFSLPTTGFVAPYVPAAPVQARFEGIDMMARGAPKKAAPAKAKGLFSGSVAPTKSKVDTKRAVSTKKTGTTFIDVTGREYIEVEQGLSAKYDEIGVLPPLGRWDPLKIREQVRAARPPPPRPLAMIAERRPARHPIRSIA